MADEELVPVYTVSDPSHAEIIKNALEEEGMRCEIEGELQGSFTGTFEIRLFVLAGDAERAREFIAAHDAGEEE